MGKALCIKEHRSVGFQEFQCFQSSNPQKTWLEVIVGWKFFGGWNSESLLFSNSSFMDAKFGQCLSFAWSGIYMVKDRFNDEQCAAQWEMEHSFTYGWTTGFHFIMDVVFVPEESSRRNCNCNLLINVLHRPGMNSSRDYCFLSRKARCRISWGVPMTCWKAIDKFICLVEKV